MIDELTGHIPLGLGVTVKPHVSGNLALM